ncbi:MAG: hypothetical protein ACRD4Q_00070 [Candidatus Acidiferrales bacterium]
MGGIPVPPFPTTDGGNGSQDQPLIVGPSQALTDWQEFFAWLKTNYEDYGKTIGAIEQATGIRSRAFATFISVLEYAIVHLAEAESAVDTVWAQAEAAAYEHSAEPLEQAAGVEAAIAAGILIKAMTGGGGDSISFGTSAAAGAAQTLFNSLIQPFTLVDQGFDPTVVGSGKQAQQFLLSKALALSLNEWIVDQLGNHLGMGFYKSLTPFLGIIDHAVNPSNIVRQAMESSYAFLVRTPLTRDLNRQYPMKDLGASALAKMYFRGAIDLNTYTDRCLSLGLSNEYAQQLLLEAKKTLSRGDIAKLLSAGYIQQQDAHNMLTQIGYSADEIPALLWLDTHQRYFTAQERVGTKAITAWTKGSITQAQLESILESLHFTADEIAVYEIEAQFDKALQQLPGGGKSLTYAQVRAMYEKNILGVDDVIQFLQNEGYAPNDVINLVLLDFTAAEQYQLREQELANRMRVIAQEDLLSAATEQTKNETALASAKTALANELEADAKAFGQLLTAPTALQLLGID